MDLMHPYAHDAHEKGPALPSMFFYFSLFYISICIYLYSYHVWTFVIHFCFSSLLLSQMRSSILKRVHFPSFNPILCPEHQFSWNGATIALQVNVIVQPSVHFLTMKIYSYFFCQWSSCLKDFNPILCPEHQFSWNCIASSCRI